MEGWQKNRQPLNSVIPSSRGLSFPSLPGLPILNHVVVPRSQLLLRNKPRRSPTKAGRSRQVCCERYYPSHHPTHLTKRSTQKCVIGIHNRKIVFSLNNRYGFSPLTVRTDQVSFFFFFLIGYQGAVKKYKFEIQPRQLCVVPEGLNISVSLRPSSTPESCV